MQLHDVKRQHPRKRQKLIGRGGKRGTTSGRGTKGQRARSGHRIRPEIRDVIKRLPKLRGHMSLFAPNLLVTITLANLARRFTAGEIVSSTTLAGKRLISAATLRRGTVKIIGATPLTQALSIQDCLITPAARRIIEAAGGKIIVPTPASPHV
ncbi:MAG: uL15 family ribosomal protein [Patescibacteria group bacterium]